MSSGESQVYRKRKVPESGLSDISESESDESETRECLEVRKIARLTPHCRARIGSSSKFSDVHEASSSTKDLSSESESDEPEKCPICLRKIRFQTLGITDSCSHHTFCLSCLEEWSKTRKTCPVDRTEYKSILVLDSWGKVSKQIPIISVSTPEIWTQANEPIFCEICGLYNDEDRMVQCDGCDMGFHMYCLNPQIETAPTGMWLCNDCWYYYNY